MEWLVLLDPLVLWWKEKRFQDLQDLQV